MYYIINKHGIMHTIPASLLEAVRGQGGRLATPAEIAAYEGGFAEPVEVARAAYRDDLTRIKGIGERTEEALNAFGILTFAALEAADPVEVAKAMDGSSMTQVRKWQAHAAMLFTPDREA
jgi:predicted flap endonuclease-1-like 5' DNA nuclease